jgi:hypothetical protein
VQSIKTTFWNSEQRRLRTLWRLIGQVILLIAVAVPLELGVGFVAFGLLMAQEGITPSQLADPEATEGAVSPQVVEQLLFESPLLMTLSTLALLGAFIISVWLAGRFLDRRRFADFGFHLGRDWWIDFGFGLGLGAILMLIIFLVEHAAGWVTATGTFVTNEPGARFSGAILVPLVGFLAVGFYEELFLGGLRLGARIQPQRHRCQHAEHHSRRHQAGHGLPADRGAGHSYRASHHVELLPRERVRLPRERHWRACSDVHQRGARRARPMDRRRVRPGGGAPGRGGDASGDPPDRSLGALALR